MWFNNTNFVNADEVNIGTVSTKGVDVEGHYLWDIGAMGKLTFNLAGVYTNSFDTQPLPTSASYDCVGYYGTTCNDPIPKWRHVLGTTWATPWWGLDMTLRWRYIGPSNTDRSSSDPQLAQTYLASDSHIGGYTYLDFSASIPIGTGRQLPGGREQHRRQGAAGGRERQLFGLPEYVLQRQHLGRNLRHHGPLPLRAHPGQVLGETHCLFKMRKANCINRPPRNSRGPFSTRALFFGAISDYPFGSKSPCQAHR